MYRGHLCCEILGGRQGEGLRLECGPPLLAWVLRNGDKMGTKPSVLSFFQGWARADTEPDTQASMGLNLWLQLISSLNMITRPDEIHKEVVFRFWTVNSPGFHTDEKPNSRGEPHMASSFLLRVSFQTTAQRYGAQRATASLDGRKSLPKRLNRRGGSKFRERASTPEICTGSLSLSAVDS